MRILALYDVHGNIDALEAVLADPAAAAAEAVVVGGDAVPGAFAREVLERLGRLEVPTHWVRGNGEREVAAAVGPAPPPVDREDLAQVTAAITAEALGAAACRSLGDLPLTVTLDGVLFCHATPGSDEELLTRISPPERYAAAFGDVDAALVVVGHTHQQHEHSVGDTRVVNAGSVGLPYEGDGAARWLLVTDGAPEFRHTVYDAQAAGERILAAGWPDERSTHGALIEPLPAMTITELFEQRASA